MASELLLRTFFPTMPYTRRHKWAQGPAAILVSYFCLEAFFSQPMKTSRDTIWEMHPTGRQFYLGISHNTTSHRHPLVAAQIVSTSFYAHFPRGLGIDLGISCPFPWKHCVFSYFKIKNLKKTVRGYSLNYSTTNHTTFCQTETGATVPLFPAFILRGSFTGNHISLQIRPQIWFGCLDIHVHYVALVLLTMR